MGFFEHLFAPAPRTSPANIQSMIKQAKETANIINKTKKPEIFFGRLGFLFDLLLCLKQYERTYFFIRKPSADLRDLENGLEKEVFTFIARYMADTTNKVAQMKTEKGKKNKFETSLDKLIAAFDCAHTFWEGNGIYPHYTGPLYTQKNYDYVCSLWQKV